ncbi:hypothetical protein VB713_22585 [Anabaena cylindrica UHCC 0172]|uniref:hypothetical protein n=1 Tax=Anabaena cylindrica TaxID=1165 RepID=UPI002B20F240|nr:hypothetical protein [Anabaena cylindrica]MEA5553731.1 hypothetical protein [Anabaena cylindrica UHCC 0172]
MFFKSKTASPSSHKEIALSILAGFALLGLLALSFTDKDSRQAFITLSTFSVGTAIGYLAPGQK